MSSNETIFVSVASYRDPVCEETIKNMYEMAEYPERVFAGICEQNELSNDNEKCMGNDFKYKNNIRTIRIPFYQARGPAIARYFCSTLWMGEKYYLQIDSHIKFIKNWDTVCINMIKLIKEKGLSQKPVLSYYSRVIEEYQSDPSYTEAPRICTAFFNERGMLSFNASEFIYADLPYNTPFLAAGFFFCESSFLNELPFDPNLKNIFTGEEILHSIRFYTHGWDIFSPNKDIVFHEYTRPDKPKYWTDNHFNDEDAFLKIKKLLNLDTEGREPPQYIMENIEKYGIGTARSLQDFYNFAGIDLKNKRIYKNFCKPDNKLEDSKNTDIEKFDNVGSQKKSTSIFTYISYILSILILLGVFYYIYCIVYQKDCSKINKFIPQSIQNLKPPKFLKRK